MTEEKLGRQYNLLIFRVALLRGIQTSTIALDVVLLASAVICTMLKHSINSPVLIMLFVTLMPFIAENIRVGSGRNTGELSKPNRSMQQPVNRQSANQQLLPSIEQKYNYTERRCYIRLAVYVLACMLIYFWHHICFGIYEGYWRYMPLTVLAFALILVVLMSCINTFRIRRMLSRGV